VIKPTDVEAADSILEGAGKLGCNIDGVAVCVAKALLAEHKRQERERCGTCAFFALYVEASCGRFLGQGGMTNGKLDPVKDYCSRWQVKDGEG
jgi:hypothetical protein